MQCSAALAGAAIPPATTADAEKLTAIQAADELRMSAMKSGDRVQLATVFSDDLRYAHSNGVVDTKASFIEVLASGKTKYQLFEYQERNFTFPSPGIALMSGRVRVRASTADSTMDSVLSFLSVWREEQEQWRFLAWQSCRMPAAAH